MDKSTILAMEAGEELDKLVAVEVMGELMPEFTPENAFGLQLAGSPGKSPKGNWVCLCRYDKGDIPTWRPVLYSTDISAAWLVVEKMGTLGYWCHIHNFPTRMWSVRFAPPINGEGQGVDCPSIKEAICKAALLARLEEGRSDD